VSKYPESIELGRVVKKAVMDVPIDKLKFRQRIRALLHRE
jgi:hypothetical protein